jgi:hypothetical protein
MQDNEKLKTKMRIVKWRFDFIVDLRRMSQKRNSVLNPSLLQSITQAFSQSIPITSENLSVNKPQEIVIDDNTQRQSSSVEQTPLMILKDEFQAPTPTPRRSSNFLKGCKW